MFLYFLFFKVGKLFHYHIASNSKLVSFKASRLCWSSGFSMLASPCRTPKEQTWSHSCYSLCTASISIASDIIIAWIRCYGCFVFCSGNQHFFSWSWTLAAVGWILASKQKKQRNNHRILRKQICCFARSNSDQECVFVCVCNVPGFAPRGLYVKTWVKNKPDGRTNMQKSSTTKRDKYVDMIRGKIQPWVFMLYVCRGDISPPG